MRSATEVITDELDALPPSEHAQRLRELLGAVAGGLVFVEGDQKASEALYRVADKIAVLRP